MLAKKEVIQSTGKLLFNWRMKELREKGKRFLWRGKGIRIIYNNASNMEMNIMINKSWMDWAGLRNQNLKKKKKRQAFKVNLTKRTWSC